MAENEKASELVKLSCLLTRRSDLTHEEFLDYWTHHHTALLSKPAPGAPPVRRYVQLYTLGDTMPGFLAPSCDGVAEIWLDSVEDAVRMFTSDYYHSVIAVDEANFLDRSKSVMMLSRESVIA